MAREITTAVNFNKRDMFNIVGADTLEKVKGQVIKVVGVALGTDVSHDTGEVVPTGYLKDADGNIYSTISPTAQQSIELLGDLLVDEPDVVLDVKVATKKSNAGRDFIVLTLV